MLNAHIPPRTQHIHVAARRTIARRNKPVVDRPYIERLMDTVSCPRRREDMGHARRQKMRERFVQDLWTLVSATLCWVDEKAHRNRGNTEQPYVEGTSSEVLAARVLQAVQ